MENYGYAYQLRFILIGDSTVGKSSLLRQFSDGKFFDFCDPTVGVDFNARIVNIGNNVNIKLQLWDTAGQERFRSITRSYYRNSVGCLLVYDISNRDTFDHLHSWLDEAKCFSEPHGLIFILVGCKCDLEKERQVSIEEGKKFAQVNEMQFLEASAKIKHNVDQAFSTLARDIYKLIQKGQLSPKSGWDGIKPGENFSNSTLIRGDRKDTLSNSSGAAAVDGSCC